MLETWGQLQGWAIFMWNRRWFRICSYLMMIYWIGRALGYH